MHKNGRKLSVDQEAEIKVRYATGDWTQRALAELYGCAQRIIYSIVHDKRRNIPYAQMTPEQRTRKRAAIMKWRRSHRETMNAIHRRMVANMTPERQAEYRAGIRRSRADRLAAMTPQELKAFRQKHSLAQRAYKLKKPKET